MSNKEIQFVVSVLDCSHEGDFGAGCHWYVKVGQENVGNVFKMRAVDDRWDRPEHHGRWAWDDANEDAAVECSLDLGEDGTTYATRMEAVWALLGRLNVDRHGGILG